MSGEYISREAAIKSTWMILEGMGYPRSENRSLERTVEAVFKSAPAADVVEMRHGRWERVGDCDKWICSECKEENLYAYSYGDDDYELQDFYCPNCGARMDGGQED